MFHGTRILHPDFAQTWRKPTGAVRVKSKYLGMGMTGLYLMRDGRFGNEVNGTKPILGSGVSHAIAAGEACAHSTDADIGNVLNIGGAEGQINLSGASDVTVILKALIDDSAGSAEQSIFGVYDRDPSSGFRFYLRQDNANNNIDLWAMEGGTSRSYVSPAGLTTWYHDGAWALNEIHTLAVRFSNSLGSIDWFEDGKKYVGSTPPTEALTSNVNANPISIGGRKEGAGGIDNWMGCTFWCAVFRGVVPDAVLLDVTRTGSPREFLEPAIPIVLASVSGPPTSHVSYEATPGALTLAGQTADQAITGHVGYEATPGAVALTGAAADVEITAGANLSYDGTPGTLSLSGQAADQVITTNLELEATPGDITLTGQAADVQTGVFIAAEATPGALSLTGQAATVDILTNLSLDANPGSIVLSGAQAEVLGLVSPVTTQPQKGGAKHRGRAPKTVIIGKKRYQVETPEQEAQLVRGYIAELEREQDMATLQVRPAEARKVKRRIKLAKTRLRKLDVDPVAHLKRMDDEIVTILAGTPWL